VTSDPVPCAGSPLLTGSRRAVLLWLGSVLLGSVLWLEDRRSPVRSQVRGSRSRSRLRAPRLVRRPVRPFCSSSIRPRGAYRRRPPPSRRARCPQIASGAFTPGSLTFRASSVGLTIGDVTLAVRVLRALRGGGVLRAAQVPPSNARRPVAAPVRPLLFRLFRSFGSVRFLALAGHHAGFVRRPLSARSAARGCSAIGSLSSVLAVLAPDRQVPSRGDPASLAGLHHGARARGARSGVLR